MKILGVEGSATSASVSVVENGKVIALESSNTGLTHSQTLMPMVESTLKKADTTIKDIDYIADPTMVVEFIMKKYYENDFVFIKKFANNFSKYYECSSTAPEVLQASTSSIRESKRNKLFETIDQNGDLLITRLVKLLILKHKENFDGTIAYSNEVNYRNLHTVIAFINNYYNNQENTNEQLIIQEYLQIKPAKSSQKEIVVKTKTRKKTHTPLEGQLSIFK
jgi:hypothetical protein